MKDIHTQLRSDNCTKVGSFLLKLTDATSSHVWLYDETEIIISTPDNEWMTMTLDEFNEKHLMATTFGTISNCERLNVKYS